VCVLCDRGLDFLKYYLGEYQTSKLISSVLSSPLWLTASDTNGSSCTSEYLDFYANFLKMSTFIHLTCRFNIHAAHLTFKHACMTHRFPFSVVVYQCSKTIKCCQKKELHMLLFQCYIINSYEFMEPKFRKWK
jgi:hypothetical protein